MKVLLIHPEDGLEDGPWTACRWDRIVDLGCSGMESYRQAAKQFGCPVTRLDTFLGEFRDQRKVRDLLALGLGRLVDRFDLDWWELVSLLVHQQLEVVVLLNELVQTLGPSDEVHISRHGLHASALEMILPSRPRVYPLRPGHAKGSTRHYARVASKFPVRQLLEIFWDKVDCGYQFRGRFTVRPKPATIPVVLLPTAYVNVSRTGVAYARALPGIQFLMVATRPSGWLKQRPANVSMAWLKSYASVGAADREAEHADLVARWRALQADLSDIPELRMLIRMGAFADVPRRIAVGCEIRDAWRNVLDAEPVQAVLCADDTNPYTHIPLLLAKQRGLPTVSCHHGALDGRYIFKRVHADVILAKGKMEEDYLLRVCGVAKERVEIGAPASPQTAMPKTEHRRHSPKPCIVFFSESYEVSGARGKDFYLDVLPPLATLALSEGRELVVKLHPAESASERRRFVTQVLSPEQQTVTRVVSGPLQADLIERAWFAVTILSTVATECAVRGIPCFLCKWLESWPYGYIDQFARFGVGLPLDGPAEILDIPSRLGNYAIDPAIRESCWQPIEPSRFEALLGFGPNRDHAHDDRNIPTGHLP